ncbi:MAG: ribonuclease III [Acetatifactor sp.]|nr:ribonuclease III [Acetatifactor sp.]
MEESLSKETSYLSSGQGTEEQKIGGQEAFTQGEGLINYSLLADILKFFPGKRQDVRAYSPLTLAYIGDAVYDLIIRTVVVERANRPANELHHITVGYVSAGAQAKIVEALMEELTEEEQSVYRRGRNSKPHTMAKNASAGDYLRATGFEAVLGYLYLSDRMDRVLELIKKGIELAGLKL